MKDRFKYKVISFSVDRNTHEKKKEWLFTQGVFFEDYDFENVSSAPTWPGLNFYWCFDNPETALIFKLKWGNRSE